MNWDLMEGKWKQAKGAVKQKWGKLTDDDLDLIGGSRDKLVGRIQERYGLAKDAAENEVDSWSLPESETQPRQRNDWQRKTA